MAGLPITMQDATFSTQQFVDASHNAGRVSIRPWDHQPNATMQQGGAFRLGVAGSAITATLAANSVLFTATNRASNLKVVVTRIEAYLGVGLTAFTTGGAYDLVAFKFAGWTGAAAGGTAITVGGAAVPSTNKVRSDGMANSSALADIRVVAAAAVTAATGKTNDTNAFAYGLASLSSQLNAGASSGMIPLYQVLPGEYPITLNFNEGIEVQNNLAGQAVGTLNFRLNISWLEVAQF